MKKKPKTAPPAEQQSAADLNKGKAPPFTAASDGDGDEDDDEDEEDEDVSKSQLALDDLEKGLKELEEAGRTPPTRKDELLEKAKTTRLTSSEFAELEKSLVGSNIVKSLEEDEDLSKAMDVSPALDSLATVLGEALDRLDGRLEKSDSAREDFQGALARSFVAMGAVIRAQQEQLDRLEKSLETTPAHAPKSANRSGAVDRPFQGVTPPATTNVGGTQLDRRKLTPVLEQMFASSMEKGQGGRSQSGLNIKDELTKSIVGGELSPAILKDAAEFVKARA